MLNTHLVALALTLILAAFSDHKEALPPWQQQFGEVAGAIAGQCRNAPLAGFTAEECVGILVEISHQESRVNVAAEHDGRAGLGLYGLHHATLGHRVPTDAEGQTEAAMTVLRQSFAICRAQDRSARLGWYMAGGRGCDKRLGLSRYRVSEALRLLRRHSLGAVASHVAPVPELAQRQ